MKPHEKRQMIPADHRAHTAERERQRGANAACADPLYPTPELVQGEPGEDGHGGDDEEEVAHAIVEVGALEHRVHRGKHGRTKHEQQAGGAEIGAESSAPDADERDQYQRDAEGEQREDELGRRPEPQVVGDVLRGRVRDFTVRPANGILRSWCAK